MSFSRKSSALSGASLGVLATLILAAPASAQPVQLGPVTVQDQTDKNALNHAPPISTMPSSSLQDTPQAVTVISGETMKQQATSTLGEALRNVPSTLSDAPQSTAFLREANMKRPLQGSAFGFFDLAGILGGLLA